MKWYKAYVNLKGHPKRFRFEEALGVDHGLHYIHLWFSYIAEYAQGGDVTSFSKKEIAKACEWQGDPQLFFDALTVGGFIDKVRGGDGGSRLIAHEWFQENERYIKENEKRKPTGNPQKTRKKPALEEKRIEVIEEKIIEQEKDNKEKTPKAAKPPSVSSKSFTDYFWAQHIKAHGQKPMPAIWAFKQCAKVVDNLGLPEAQRRCDNFFSDPYLKTHALEDFVGTPDKWIELRAKLNTDSRADTQVKLDRRRTAV